MSPTLDLLHIHGWFYTLLCSLQAHLQTLRHHKEIDFFAYSPKFTPIIEHKMPNFDFVLKKRTKHNLCLLSIWSFLLFEPMAMSSIFNYQLWLALLGCLILDLCLVMNVLLPHYYYQFYFLVVRCKHLNGFFLSLF